MNEKTRIAAIEEVSRVYEMYVNAFGVGDLFTRQDFVRGNKLPYSTVVYNLECAVKAGKLNRQKRVVGTRPTWVYGLPETLPRLEGL